MVDGLSKKSIAKSKSDKSQTKKKSIANESIPKKASATSKDTSALKPKKSEKKEKEIKKKKKVGASPKKKKSKYFEIVKSAIIGIKSPNGVSYPALENYLNAKKVKFLPLALKQSIKIFLENGRLARHHLHSNSYVLPSDYYLKKFKSSLKNEKEKKEVKQASKSSKNPPSKKVLSTQPKTSKSSKKSASSTSFSSSPSSSSSSTTSLASHVPSSVIVLGSGLATKGHIFSEAGVNFNTDLAFQDEVKNSNKFYKLQVIESNSSPVEYWCVQNWGRIGTQGQCKTTGPTTKDEALKVFRNMFKEKSGTEFGAGGGVFGKYSLVEMRAQAEGGRLADKQTVTFCLAWNDKCDLDIYVKCPDGKTCYSGNKQCLNPSGQVYCELDVDKMASHYPNQVENIFIDASLAPKGEYIFYVNVFSKLPSIGEIDFQTTFNNRGDSREFSGSIAQGKRELVRFTLE